MRMRANLLWLLVAAASVIGPGLTASALAATRLAVRPVPGPPTPAPLVPHDDFVCLETIRSASSALAEESHRWLGGCLLPALSCLEETTLLERCCESAARGCERDLENLHESIANFEAKLTGDGCEDLPFSRVLSEDGLGFDATLDACGRLIPPVQVRDLKSLARCMSRLIVEDVVHRAVSVEHPRALEAVLCMGNEDDIPGVLRDDPATCEGDSGPNPTPTPTPVATPQPTATAGGATPTPRPSNGATPTPGGATPTPGGATPTPAQATPTPTPGGGETCESVIVKVDVDFDANDFPDVSGINVALDYPEDKVSLPGFAGEPTVLARVTNKTGVSGGLFNVGDQDTDINIGLVSISSAIPPGPFAELEFDCEPGASAPAPSEFDCTVDGSTLLGGSVDATCSLQVDVN